MKIETSGLPPGPIQNFANALNTYLTRLRSVPAVIVADTTKLPKPSEALNGATIIVRDIDGSGNPGKATCLDGVWYDQSWSAL